MVKLNILYEYFIVLCAQHFFKLYILTYTYIFNLIKYSDYISLHIKKKTLQKS